MKNLLFIICSVFVLNTKAQIITTVCGNGTSGCTGDGGYAIAAELKQPYAVNLDAAGNLYIVDAGNNNIRKVNTAGIISTIVGSATGAGSYGGDGGQATAAHLAGPQAVAFDAAGNMYIADEGNHRIRKVNTLGIISTVAGNGTGAYTGDGGQATSAGIYNANAVTLDAAGNLYITDGVSCVRMVNTNGIISTYAGTGTAGFIGDGGAATLAELNFPFGIAFDAVGNLYIGDYGNNRIRKVNTSGTISTIAGNGTAGYFGDGGAATSTNAELNQPWGVTFDVAGNLYIADNTNNVIRQVNTAGIINLVAGNFVAGFSGDGGAATSAELNNSRGVAFDAAGNMYIADRSNARIRMVSKALSVSVNSPTICAGATTTLTASGANTYSWSTNATTTSISPSPTVTTNYIVTGTNTFTAFFVNSFSTGSATATISVNTLPTVTVTSNTISLCKDSTAILQANGANTYTWSTSATTTTIVVTPTVTTTYTLIGTDANGCVNTNTITQVVTNCSTTGINQFANNNELTIYPNPSNGVFNLSISQFDNEKINSVEVRNLIGECVHRQIATSANCQINVADIEAGVYFIQVINQRTSAQSAAKKIIITK